MIERNESIVAKMLGQGEKIAGGIKCVVHQNAASQPQAQCPATIIQHGYCSRNFSWL